jgi:tRNA-specific 2-thiouridylase
VFKYTISQYKKGLTPNPDILCNKYIKFKDFIDYTKKEFGVNTIAMGHYAKIIKKGNKKYLALSKDDNHDQTYFLSGLSQEQINHVIFPISNLNKDEVRDLANKAGLPT